MCVCKGEKMAALKCIMPCSELYWGQQVMDNNNGGRKICLLCLLADMVTHKKIFYIPTATVSCSCPAFYTHTTSESSYAGFNSLNRSSGSLGISTEILRHVVHFLCRSSSLIEVDGLWSWWACESKTCTKTRLSVTHGWRHADVILIRLTQSEITFISMN